MADYIYVYNGKRIAPSSGKILGIKMPPVPEKTLRFKFSNTSFNPVTDTYSNDGVSTWHWTPVSKSIGIYDFTYSGTNWAPTLPSGTTTILNDVRSTADRYPLNKNAIVGDVDIIDSNLAGVTSVDYLFQPMRTTLTKVNLKNTSSLTRGYNWGNSNGVSKLTEVYVEDTSNMTTMESMFTGCTALTTVNPLRADSCTTTRNMFNRCQSLSQPVSMSNMTSVTNMSSMFNACIALTTIDNIDMTACTNAASMFQQCASLTTIGNLNLPVCTDAGNMFKSCSRITSIGNIYMPSCRSAGNIFNDCTNLTTVGNIDLSACTSLNIFTGRTALTTVGNIDMSACTNATNMFQSCSSLVTVSSITTTSALKSVGSMFARCYALETIPLFDTSGVTSFFGGNRGGMCAQCTSLKSVPLFDTSSATDVTYMFSGCTAVESGALALYQQMSTQTTPPTTYNNCFANCGSNTATGQAELAQIPTSWGGTMAE